MSKRIGLSKRQWKKLKLQRTVHGPKNPPAILSPPASSVPISRTQCSYESSSDSDSGCVKSSQPLMSQELETEEELSGSPCVPKGNVVGTSGPKNATSLRATMLTLTWPQNDMNKALLMSKLLEFFDAKQVVVAQEFHEDGNPHLHAFVHLQRRSVIKHSLLDKIGGKHGNYQPTKSKIAWLKYLAKSDPSPACFGMLFPLVFSLKLCVPNNPVHNCDMDIHFDWFFSPL